MIPYRKNSRKATASTEYARGLTIAAHPKSQWVFQDPDFQDRAPNQPPRRLGEIANKVVAETGEKALRHWLDKVAQAGSEQERRAAMETAQNIAKSLGLTLEDFLLGRAA